MFYAQKTDQEITTYLVKTKSQFKTVTKLSKATFWQTEKDAKTEIWAFLDIGYQLQFISNEEYFNLLPRFGLHVYDDQGNSQGWLYRHRENGVMVWDVGKVESCKAWKTEEGAETNLAKIKCKIIKPDWTIQVKKLTTMTTKSAQQKWNEQNPEIIRESKANYDQKRPVWSFRPEPELIKWLEEERWENEATAELLNRKLTKLMKLEQQGY